MQFLPEIGSGAQATPARGGCWEGLRPSAEFYSAPEPPAVVSASDLLCINLSERVKNLKK